MKCIILAAGYATRLYPLTENFPKPLLDVNGKAIIDWLVDDLDVRADIDEYIVVTNHRFVEHFNKWKESKVFNTRITILDDGSTENENRLGAVRDIAYAIDELSINDDLIVLAGDNVLDFSLASFIKYFGKKNSTCIMRHYENNVSKLQRTGVVLIDNTDKVISMEEKPCNPKSNWAVPPFYIYKAEDLLYFKKALEEKCDTDAPGSFISWLCNYSSVYAFEMPGNRYDIGNMESYESVRNMYFGIKENFDEI